MLKIEASMANGLAKEKREHPRYFVEGIHGSMHFASEVRVLNISDGGVAVETDKRMNIGAQYALKLYDNNEDFIIKGTVVWSSITYARHTARGETVPLYHAGMQFRLLSTEGSRHLYEFINRNKLAYRRKLSGLRFIISNNQAVLDYPFQYTVKNIGIGGMLIQCNQPLIENKIYHMELFLDNHVPVSFTGRVASCRSGKEGGMKHFNVGIEFVDISDNSRINIEEYIKVLEPGEE
jgi:Tfp pilus assembly protein PilZ